MATMTQQRQNQPMEGGSWVDSTVTTDWRQRSAILHPPASRGRTGALPNVFDFGVDQAASEDRVLAICSHAD